MGLIVLLVFGSPRLWKHLLTMIVFLFLVYWELIFALWFGLKTNLNFSCLKKNCWYHLHWSWEGYWFLSWIMKRVDWAERSFGLLFGSLLKMESCYWLSFCKSGCFFELSVMENHSWVLLFYLRLIENSFYLSWFFIDVNKL